MLATRSPYRPNPIGITVADVISVQGNRIKVTGLDALKRCISVQGVDNWLGTTFFLRNIEISSKSKDLCSQEAVIRMLVKFDIYFDGEHWCARGIGVSIFTEGKTLDELTENLKEAASLHFEDLLEAGEELKILSISEFEVQPLAKASGC